MELLTTVEQKAKKDGYKIIQRGEASSGTPEQLASGLRLLVFLLCLFSTCLTSARAAHAVENEPDPLSFDDLVELYERETPSPELMGKLNRILTAPVVSNFAGAGGAGPLKPTVEGLGRILRVAQWNIERGLEYDAVLAALKGPESFSVILDSSAYPEGTSKRSEILDQAALLRGADCIVLNEVDWGLKRTEYRNVIAELAAALNMNYAFGVEFVEVDPISLGIESFDEARPEDRAELVEEIRVDRARYKGLHGTAILSRYPLENVRIVRFSNQGHDWYRDEKKGTTTVEKGKRKAGELVFLEKARREVRRGGRMMLIAEIADSDIPSGRLTIVATHLEDRTKPKNRVRQLEELLAEIKELRTPVVVAGDMNTSTQDMTPTSVGREIKKRLGSKSFWIKRGISYATGVGLPFDIIKGGLNSFRKQADPTVRNIYFIAPNSEAKFFKVLKRFRFSDGASFDFRGERGRSIRDSTETLANSNERGSKGFATTFEVERKIGFVGKFKLDWFFVKPALLTDPYEKDQPYRFAPHFGRTLKKLNRGIEDRISDHDPILVDLPFNEPRLR